MAAKRVEIPFTFTNTGDDSITILDVASSCGCTTTALPKRTFEPGEKGTLTAVFTPNANNLGKSFSLHVTTSDTPDKTLALTFRVLRSQLIKVSAAGLKWALGSLPTEQTVQIDAPPGTELQIAPLRPGDLATLTATLERIEGKPGYVLKVKPTATNTPSLVTLFLKNTPATGQRPPPPILITVRIE